jgi:hypothetical protein
MAKYSFSPCALIAAPSQTTAIPPFPKILTIWYPFGQRLPKVFCSYSLKTTSFFWFVFYWADTFGYDPLAAMIR